MRNNQSARVRPDFVSAEIVTLLNKGLISKVSHVPTVVNPLTVASNSSGKLRMVLDCRHLNFCLHKFKVTYDDVNVARQIFSKGDFAIQFDLKSAYHHIEIFPDHRDYLGFYWKCSYYVFNVLPFGLSTAGYVFTKVLRHLVKYWRSNGIKVIMYLDDGIAVGNNKLKTVKVAEQIRSDLIKFGFLIAEEKSNWLPSQSVIWLGLCIDFNKAYIYLPHIRLTSIINGITTILNSNVYGKCMVRARKLASIIGAIQSARAAIGKVTDVMTKYSHMCVETRSHWDGYVIISDDAKNELQFWLHNLSKINGKPFVNMANCTAEVYSDASGVGYGGYETHTPGSEVWGKWTGVEAKQSSTWRELKTVYLVAIRLACILKSKNVRWNVDNLNVVHVLKKGSMKPKLQHIVLDIMALCSKHKITLITVWIPRNLNVQADILSKMSYKDTDNWQIHPSIFHYLNSKWGPFTIDRFATVHNRKCNRFNSRIWLPGTEAVDSFTEHWAGEMNWLVPPPKLIIMVIKKMKFDGAKGAILVPEWKSAPYWPLLFPETGSAVFISETEVFPVAQCVLPGRDNNGIFSRQDCTFNIVAMLIDFSKPVFFNNNNQK